MLRLIALGWSGKVRTLFAKIDELGRGSAAIYVLALIIVTVLYSVVLAITTEQGFVAWGKALAANVASLGLCAIAARLLITRYVLPSPFLLQSLIHAFAAVVFSICWFFLLMVLLGMTTGEDLMTFSVRPFFGPAAAWQLMQGATFYGMIALLAYVETMRVERGATTQPAPSNRDEKRIFVRDGDEMRPLDPERIMHVTAARDYAEVTTRTGTHMLRITLSELEKSLGSTFLRIHRSCLVNIDQIDRVEPAGGGRLHLHMLNGATLTASRSGAKLIRERSL